MATQAASIIPVFTGTIDHETAHLVDARTLHRFLEVGKVFGAWIKERIKQYGFEENQDFLIASQSGEAKTVAQNWASNTTPQNGGAEGIFQNGKKPLGGRPRTEYHLTLDMAKELSMVERNEKGKQARRYFIECEKQLHAIAPEVAHRIADDTIGTDGLKILRELIGKKVRVLPSSARNSAQHRLWNLLHTRFNVPKAEMIAANDMDAAANFVAQWAIEGEYLECARPPAAEARKSQTLYYSLIALQHYLDRISRTLPGEALTQDQRERYQHRIDNCLEDCIELAKDPSRIAETGEISTILRNLEGLAGRANALERDFVERVGPALKLLDSRLYGNWREHIGVLSRYLTTSRGRGPIGTLALN
ncbi:antA/AntB antirepressor family protein [Salinicola aestuarinus]|uniref:antA/AntB antirepressor family protein n=1 Tax=Salinicola aestuarinus TaxID=1949082 RepID=UPI000DA219CA|nr:antA/AntB antirepressor family protein [Salinicola aestuarinus]